MADSSSDIGSPRSSSPLAESAPSSPPSAGDLGSPKMATDLDERRLLEEEESARKQNNKDEAKRLATARRKNKTKAATQSEREQKARELDELLKQSAAFSDILTKKTEVLGRVGSGFDGKTLGEHDLTMAEQPKCLVGGKMRDYQLEGLTWMYEICSQGMSGILADEMGLGKTVQTISLIALLRERENYLGPHLIVAPLSTLSNWMNEFHFWTPSIPVVMYHGNPSQREEIRNTRIMPHIPGGRPTKRFPVVCTSYEIILRDRIHLSKINWEFIIIDEGHRMKNFDTKLFRELQQFRSATRLLITGTPLQNNLKELWSLLNFLMPNIFTNWEAFEQWFDFSDLKDEEGTQEFIQDKMKQDLVKKIHLILQPLLLRRVKADVASNLPKKREYVLFAPMTKEQTDLYNVINDKNIDTRSYLEDKVVQRLTGATNTPATSRKASPRTSRSSSVIPKIELMKGSKPQVLSQRSSPLNNKTQGGPPMKANAFSLMMGQPRGRGRPRKSDVASEPASTPVKSASKRKAIQNVDEPESKSSKSSRQSTPASARGRPRKGRKPYKEDEASDDDLLSDDEFEAKIAEEFASEDAEELASLMSAEDFERAQTLDLAKKEIGLKKLGNPLVQLRLVCNSPHNFYNPWANSAAAPVDETIVTSSGKMLLLDRLLPILFDDGHKVLIFSQFKTQLDILEDYCRELRGWNVCRIDGSVAQDDRRTQIDDFNNDPDHKIFLLSTRAGGQGINLASADTVILFDSDWNPQQDLQAQDRCHRIGQTRPVIVYRLATKGTVEEELLLSADAKRRLEKLVIKKGGFKTIGLKMDTSEDLDKDTLQALLLKDGEVYNFSGDKEILTNEDIAVICDRSEEAYLRAARGDGDADAFKVVETGVDGIKQTAKAA